MSEQKKTIEDLRAVLFDTIEAVKNGQMGIEKAKCISELAQVMTNTAKVEVQFAQATGAKASKFLEPASTTVLPAGITGITQHRIKG